MSKATCCAALFALATLSLAHALPSDTSPADPLIHLRSRGNAFLIPETNDVGAGSGDGVLSFEGIAVRDQGWNPASPRPLHPLAPPREPSNAPLHKRATPATAVFPPSSSLLAEAAVTRMQTWYIAPNVEWTPWWQFALLGMTYSSLDLAFGNSGNKALIESLLSEWAYTDYMIDAYIDDQSWWAMFALRAYQAHGNPDWLKAAEVINTNSSAYWTDQCGGGVLWLVTQPESKNTITNGLYFSTVARLFRYTNNPTDFNDAVNTLNWWLTWAFDASTGKVYDTIGYPGCLSNRTGLESWSYNSGAMLFGLADLYHATGNETLLDLARTIAYAGMRDFSDPVTGVIQESCEHSPAAPGSGNPPGCQQDEICFKGSFMLALGELYLARPDANIYNYINTQLMSVVYNNVDKSWLFGEWWNGPWNETTAGPKTQINTLCLVAAAATVNGDFIAKAGNGSKTVVTVTGVVGVPAAAPTGPSSSGRRAAEMMDSRVFVGAVGLVTLALGLGVLI